MERWIAVADGSREAAVWLKGISDREVVRILHAASGRFSSSGFSSAGPGFLRGRCPQLICQGD